MTTMIRHFGQKKRLSCTIFWSFCSERVKSQSRSTSKMQITSPTTAFSWRLPNYPLITSSSLGRPAPPHLSLAPFRPRVSRPKVRRPPSPRQRMSSFLSNWTSLARPVWRVRRSLAPFFPRGGFSLVYVCVDIFGPYRHLRRVTEERAAGGAVLFHLRR